MCCWLVLVLSCSNLGAMPLLLEQLGKLIGLPAKVILTVRPCCEALTAALPASLCLCARSPPARVRSRP